MARSKYTKHQDHGFADESPATPEATTAEATGADGEASSADAFVSRSAKKRESDAMKALGMQLAELSPKQLGEMALGDALFRAITDYQRITSNSARRRQRGYIGGLLRSDPELAETIRAQHAAMTEHDANAKRVHHELEDWRERLIAQDSALTDFLNKYPGTQIQQLRVLIRRARTAKDDAQRKLATRALYRALADIAQT